MPIVRCAWLVPALTAAMAGTAAAQAPTLPSDTLHANFTPHFDLEPSPEGVPDSPGDTLVVPLPGSPDDALLGDPDEVPIPPRIASLRLA